METKFVGVKEFRQNIADFAKKARTKKTRFVVVNRNKPLFEITPFAEDETLGSLFNDILLAKKDVKEGRIHTEEAILAEFS